MRVPKLITRAIVVSTLALPSLPAQPPGHPSDELRELIRQEVRSAVRDAMRDAHGAPAREEHREQQPPERRPDRRDRADRDDHREILRAIHDAIANFHGHLRIEIQADSGDGDRGPDREAHGRFFVHPGGAFFPLPPDGDREHGEREHGEHDHGDDAPHGFHWFFDSGARDEKSDGGDHSRGEGHSRRDKGDDETSEAHGHQAMRTFSFRLGDDRPDRRGLMIRLPEVFSATKKNAQNEDECSDCDGDGCCDDADQGSAKHAPADSEHAPHPQVIELRKMSSPHETAPARKRRIDV